MSDSFTSLLKNSDRRIKSSELIVVGGLIIALMWMLGRWLQAHVAFALATRNELAAVRDSQVLDIAERQALWELASRHYARAQQSAVALSRARKVIFEGGLALSEEKRLLEKQLEIMDSGIRIDERSSRISLMRGESIIDELVLTSLGLRAVAGDLHSKPLSAVVISKERFASPERPKSEQSGGQLQWEPPQVGTSVRANALGEFVLFTKEGLIIHGPPIKSREHEDFPHLCLLLPTSAARRLYEHSFIGTRITINNKAP